MNVRLTCFGFSFFRASYLSINRFNLCLALAALILSQITTAFAAPPNGSQWIPLGGTSTSINGNVLALATDTNGNLYAGGQFYLGPYGSSPLYQIAEWNGSSWTGIGDTGGEVYALAFDQSGDLFAAGIFDYLEEFDGTNWHAFETGVDAYGYALALDQSGNVYEGCAATAQGGPGGILELQGGKISRPLEAALT